MGAIARLLGKEPYNNWPRSHDRFRSDMSKAAGIGVARIRCHRNTWVYLEENVPWATVRPGTAFYPPTEDEVIPEKDGMVTVALSGTTLAAVLHFCHDIQIHLLRKAWTDLDRAIGRRVGSAISQALLNATPSSDEDRPTTVIYLDDRIAEKVITA
ncbi:hypothetical protein AB0I69_46625 [Streptomyces sp. NPDC050508]|uniref:hypothetical protein n=1 Tax=Streptomyces sp. NPDC050508 TaxID=3155405 RepID=UPI00341DF4BF